MREKLFNCKGLSLVEVVMSAMAMALLLAGIYAVFIASNNITAVAYHKAVALHWAQSALEFERSDFRGVFGDPSEPNELTISKSGVRTPLESFWGVGVKRERVTVTWTE